MAHRRGDGWSSIMGGLLPEETGHSQAGSTNIAYATVQGPLPKRGGKFKGKLVVKTEIGQERLIIDYSDTSWKAINDELCRRRHRSEAVASLIYEMSLRLEEAKYQKEMQDLQRMDSRFVILYKRQRLIGNRPEIAVYVQSVGWNSMQAAQQGFEGDMLPLGPAEDGDEIIVKRGVVRIDAPILLVNDLTFSRERNYAGGGGGGWSGGGGGGYGLGGGGGGGTYVIEGATNVEIKVGTQYRKGHEVVVGNTGDGCVIIREPIMGEAWDFECVEGCEEWLPPRTGLYIIKAMGGAGASAGSFKGGTGCSVEGMFHLEENAQVLLVCGRMGKTFTDRWGSCGGGGGATAVFLSKMDEKGALIVAGGGGGAASPWSSNGGNGGHASMTTEGKNGFGAYHGEGGRNGRAGKPRHIRTCFLDPAGGCARFMSEDKVNEVWTQSRGFFPGAGSGIFEYALGSAQGISQGDLPKGPQGVARGGFGGGGCGEWHPEETRIEGHSVDAVFHCRSGNPIIRDQVLNLSGHVPGAEYQPQCILVDGGNLTAEQIDMVCHEGNSCVVKSHKKSRYDDSQPGILRMDDCTVNNCGGNGLLVLEGGTLEASNCILASCNKDGVDVKGKGSSALISKCSILKTGARAVIVSKGADVTVADTKMDKSKSSGCVSMGQGSSLKLKRCSVTTTSKHGVMVSDGAHCELRRCNIIASHDCGILAIGVVNKLLDEETSVRVIHCSLKKNGYGVWAQDGAELKLLGGVVTGSVNEDITQHTQPNMKTASKLVTMGGAQLRVVFVSWRKETQTTKALIFKLKELSKEELEDMILNIFNEFDTDNSGTIKESELSEALERLGLKLNESDIRNLLQDMDENNDGLLSVAEFTLFCYKLVGRKRGRVPRDPPVGLGGLSKQGSKEQLVNPDEFNVFRFPEAGDAIVIRKIRLQLEQLCENVLDLEEDFNASSTADAHAATLHPTPLAFSTIRPATGAAMDNGMATAHSRTRINLREILQECEEKWHRVSKYFVGSQALMQALQDAQEGDVVLLGAGRHLLSKCAHLTKSIGICSAHVGGSHECEIVCHYGESFEISSGKIIFVGLKLTRAVDAQSWSNVTVKGGNLMLQSCTMATSSGCAIVCTVESIDCNVVCAGCQFVNTSQGSVALTAKDGAVANLVGCELLGCSLYATHGGLMNIDSSQVMDSTHDSIRVDSDGVVKVRNSKVIGSLQNGITIEERGMLTLHKCDVIRSQRHGLECSGACSTAHLTESTIREGWTHGVNIFDGASAEFEQSAVLINKGIGCVASGTGVRLRMVDTMVSSNEQDGLVVQDGARADIWSKDADVGEGAMIRQNGWCGIRVSGPSTCLKCSQAKIKLNGQHGLLAQHGAAVTARLLDVDANTATGIMAVNEKTVVDMFSCTSTGNHIGVASSSSLVRANSCRVVRNMCNVLEELDGRVEVDQRGGAARSTSELLPRIDVSRGPKAKPPRPATPLKKPGDRSRRRGGSSGGDTPTSGRSNNSLPQISSGLSSPIPHVDDDPGTPQPELD